MRELGVDCRGQVAGDAGDHLWKLDRLRDVVDEVDEDPDIDEEQRLGHRDGQVGDEAPEPAAGRDRPEGEHAIDERRHPDAESQLVADVAHEVPHHPRPELLRGQRQGQDGDREDDTHHRDHGGGDGDEDLPGGIGVERTDPERVAEVAVVGGDVEAICDGEQKDAHHDENSREEPQRRAHLFPLPGGSRQPTWAAGAVVVLSGRSRPAAGADHCHHHLSVGGRGKAGPLHVPTRLPGAPGASLQRQRRGPEAGRGWSYTRPQPGE